MVCGTHGGKWKDCEGEVMSCPTCDHTMVMVDKGMFYCERCGTAKVGDWIYVPSLIKRCKAFADEQDQSKWITLGISESINLPNERKVLRIIK